MFVAIVTGLLKISQDNTMGPTCLSFGTKLLFGFCARLTKSTRVYEA